MRYFNSNGAFDKHRTGKHGVNRRCMTEQEMLEKGMLINKDGFWIGEAMMRKFHEDEATEDDTEAVECEPCAEGSEQAEPSQVG